MRILQVHNAYQITGGEEVVVAAERALLQAHGHEVELLAADNKAIVGFGGQLRAALSVVYSRRGYRALAHRLARFNPEVVHVHNFFPLLSPSIFYACRAARVPVVQTLHNYRLICPAAICYRDGQVCQDCVGKPIAWPGIRHGCYRQSRPASAAVATMLATHRWAGTWDRCVDRYLVLTEFARNRFLQAGLPAEKLTVKPNFVASPPTPGSGTGGYALFVGRLSPEKGIASLLEAWNTLGAQLPLKIAGEGQCRPATPPAGVSFLGRQTREQIAALMRQASFLVFPSVWEETFGLAIIEAYAAGLPVLASDLGSQRELVGESVGRRFVPGDPVDLARQVNWVLEHLAELSAMRRAARAEFEAKYTADRNYELLMRIYAEARLQRTADGRRKTADGRPKTEDGRRQTAD